VTDDQLDSTGSSLATDWFTRLGRPSERVAGGGDGGPEPLPPPPRVEARGGAGCVTLDWPAVDGALGYLVHRAADATGPFQPLDHHGGDVLAVPAPPYTDTTLAPGQTAWYAVATWTEAGPGRLSPPVEASAGEGPSHPIEVEVDAAATAGELAPVWRRMLGTEHLSLLARGGTGEQAGPGGADVAAEFAEALRIARDDLGCGMVRAHGTFLPEMVAINGARRPGGGPDGAGVDFSGLYEVYDRLLGLGLKPVVELSFMPRELARDPDATVFTYRGVISPPADWQAWGRLCGALARRLIERYGVDEVRTWAFEVWNEANLEVFWAGTQADYFRLYEEAARAIKAVDQHLLVGGPATARAEWVGDLLDYCRATGTPIDFVSTHTYGNAPLDFRPVTRAATATGEREPLVWWTEWGVSPTHFNPVNDAVFGAPFVLRGVKAAMSSADALAYWVLSDHFEELGWPRRLFHGGFGLLTVGNLRKPRFWALWLLGRLGPERLPVAAEGDGAGGMVDALAARDRDGTITVLLWNGTLDQTKVGGAPLLHRTVTLTVTGLADGVWRRGLHRVDAEHGNIQATWEALGSPDWPDGDGWRALRAADRLDPAEPAADLAVSGGMLRLTLDLPNPGVALVTLQPPAAPAAG
jgi:xylan 1,4-beta-xylosidase